MQNNRAFIGNKIIHFDEIPSTNTVLFNDFSAEKEGTVVIADIQTGGKGRLGRSWSSKSKQGLYFSILLKPNISIEKVPLITITAGISVCKALRKLAESEIFIKWPNDILINNKKVCGILSEGSFSDGKINFVVCGIGINVNNKSFPPEIINSATSLFLEEKKEFIINDIFEEILNEFEKNYILLLNSDPSSIINEFKSLCCTLGKEVNFTLNNTKKIGTAIDITNDGSVKVKSGEKIYNISSGEMNILNKS